MSAWWTQARISPHGDAFGLREFDGATFVEFGQNWHDPFGAFGPAL